MQFTGPNSTCISILILAAWVFACSYGLSFQANAQSTDSSTALSRECWRYESRDIESWGAASDSTNVYIAERGGRIAALSIEDGKRIWSTELDGEVVSNLLVSGQSVNVVVASRGSGPELRTLSVVSGLITGAARFDGIRHGIVRLINSGDGSVFAIAEDGRLFAVVRGVLTSVGSFATKLSAATSTGTVLAIASEDKLIKLFSGTGPKINSWNLSHNAAALAFVEDNLLVGDVRGNLYLFDPHKGRPLWRLKTGGRVSAIIPTSRSDVIVSSYDNFVYRIDVSTGHVIWRRRQAGRVSHIAILEGDVIAAATFGERGVVLLDPVSGKEIGHAPFTDEAELLQAPISVEGGLVIFTTSGASLNRFGGCGGNEKAKTFAFAISTILFNGH